MSDLDKLTKLAMELQAMAQIGLTYTKDIYDKERFMYCIQRLLFGDGF